MNSRWWLWRRILNGVRTITGSLSILIVTLPLSPSLVEAQNSAFHNAPADAAQKTNPLAGRAAAAHAGAKLYASSCSACHGSRGEGMGNVPSLNNGPTQAATDGELFWYISKGDVNNGMPSWASLPKQQRWKIITYVKTLRNAGASPAVAGGETNPASDANAPLPPAPFTDYRFEKPGLVRKIMLADLPPPFATPSAGNGPKVVPRPEGAWPQVPDGFKVAQYATGLDKARLIRTGSDGDFFVAESDLGDVKVFRGITADGKAEQMSVFASGLNRPFGINFYPPGPNPKWVYVGNTDSSSALSL